MSNDNPLVSIVALNYNNSRFVISSLDHILNQDYDNIELIIVDDYSTDGSLDLIKSWIGNCKSDVKLIAHEKNRGVCAACNSGLRHSKGIYISLIATDDLMLPNKTRVQVEAFQKATDGVCAVFSDMLVIDDKSRLCEESYNKLVEVDGYRREEFFDKNNVGQITHIINANIFPAPSMLYRRKAILELNGWDESLYFEDLDMNLRLIHAGYKYISLDEKLVKYRMMPGSLTRKPNPRYLESYLSVLFKYRGLSKEIDSSINKKINEFSSTIYQMNGEKGSFWLKRNFFISKGIKNFLLMVFSSFGIKHRRFAALQYFVNKMR